MGEPAIERIESDRRLREIFDAGVGFIFNDFEGDHTTTSSADSNKLHRAGCQECDPRRSTHAMTVKTSGQKLYFFSSKEAAAWLIAHRPNNYTRCTRCDPR